MENDFSRKKVETIIIQNHEIVEYKYSDGSEQSVDEALEEFKAYLQKVEEMMNIKNENPVELLSVPTKSIDGWNPEPYLIGRM